MCEINIDPIGVMEATNVLMVCVCGEHSENAVPLKELQSVNVCLHFIDEKDGVIKRWTPPDLLKIVEAKIEFSNNILPNDLFFYQGYRQALLEIKQVLMGGNND